MPLLKRVKSKSLKGNLNGNFQAEALPLLTGQTPQQPASDPHAPAIKRVGWRWPSWQGQGLELVVKTVFAIFCVLAISFTLVWRFDDKAVYNQQAGEAAKDDIVAPKALSYVSQVQSQKAASEAANNPANNVYRRDETVVSKQRDALNNLLATLGNGRQSFFSNVVKAASLQQLDAVKTAGLTTTQLTRILNLSDNEWQAIAEEARTTYNLVTAPDIRLDNLTNELSRLKNDVYTPWNLGPAFSRMDETSRYLVIALVQPFVAVNNVLDIPATKQKQDEARKNAAQVTVNIIKGQSIVRRGEILTPFQLEQLEQLGLRSSGNILQNTLGTVGVVVALVALMVYYFTLLNSPIWKNPRLLFFIGMALVVAAGGMRLLVTNYSEHSIRPYILPLAAVSMVLAALLDVNLAVFFTAILALLAGYVAQSPEIAAVFFVGGAAGAFMLYKAERTITFVYAGLVVAIGQFLVSLCFNLVSGTVEMVGLGLLLLINVGNGLVSTSLAFFIFSALGKLFGVTTVIQLLELAHPNQPLLRRLMREAPGTYHHSIMVSNLAEQAAEHLMGDALLARVGAYYHDIGKLSRPSNFIDNQGGGLNIHDSLDPRDSMKLIKAHVEDGVALARKNHLPRKVVDIIHQHHGTCLISYFYTKAVNMGLDVNELEFRYPGPKPQTKVAAIVMLSDGVEAAVRANIQSGRISTAAKPPVPAADNPAANSNQNSLTIQDVVNKIIDDRIRDGQLDECDLTLKDIDELRSLFVEILAGIYHPRIVYPETPKPATASPEGPKPQTVEAIVVPVREILPESLVPVSPVKIGTTLATGQGAADGGDLTILEKPEATTDQQADATSESKPRPKTVSGIGTNSGIGGAGQLVGSGRSNPFMLRDEHKGLEHNPN